MSANSIWLRALLHTKFGGLFLFLPDLVAADLDGILARSGFPGSAMVPAACAMRSLLALKLFGTARHRHVMSYVLDEGLALFAGLNAIPKRSFLTEYSCRIAPSCYPRLMRHWFDTVSRLGLRWGTSFDLDFHTIPFHGDDPLVEKHYVSKRSRSQKGMLAFLAQDAETRVFCYANAELRKDQRDDEILRFVDFWKRRTGQLPEELIFDCKLTTYAKLSELNRKGIPFITLRRRSPKLLAAIAQTPLSAWRRVELENVTRAYRTPRVLDHRITLKDYDGPLRQLTIAELGHEDPTLLLTNQLNRSASHLIGRYAQRMLIENNIEDGIDFFHMDALIVGGGAEGQLRPATDVDGQQPLPLAGRPRCQWLRGRQVPASVPGPDRRHGGDRDHRGSSGGEVSEAGAQSVVDCRWVRQDESSSSPGLVASGCGWSSDSLIRVPRPSMV